MTDNTDESIPAEIKDLYGRLGIWKNASSGEIEEAYKIMAVKWHPDRPHNQHVKKIARKQFVAIREAYEILSDSSRRAQYDCGQGSASEAYREQKRKAKEEPLEDRVKDSDYRAEKKLRNHSIMMLSLLSMIIGGILIKGYATKNKDWKETKISEKAPIEHKVQETEIYKEIDAMGRDWGSYYLFCEKKERDEKYFDEYIRPLMAYDSKTKLQFKYCDDILEHDPRAKRIIEMSEKIPDQLQTLLNRDHVNVHICDPNKDDSQFRPKNSGAFCFGRDIYLSIHQSPVDFLHEAGHQMRISCRPVTNDYNVFFDIFEKYKNSMPAYYQDNEEFFAYVFEKYYAYPEYLKKNIPEAYAFLRKFEVLNVERSLMR